MAISPIISYSAKLPAFTASKKLDKNGYENPISRSTEKGLAVLSCAGASALVGITAAFLTTCFQRGWKLPSFIGGIAALTTLALTLPSRLYNTNVNAYAKEKEMDVFARQKAAQANLYAGINDEFNEEESLDSAINHYATVKMADNGKGLMVKGA